MAAHFCLQHKDCSDEQRRDQARLSMKGLSHATHDLAQVIMKLLACVQACPICGRELQADNAQPGKSIDTIMERPGSK